MSKSFVALAVIAASAFATVASATHNEPSRRTPMVKAELVSAYRKCDGSAPECTEQGEMCPARCVGPVQHPDDPQWEDRDCGGADCGSSPACLRACSTSQKNDEACSLLPKGRGSIKIAQKGDDLKVSVSVRGISPDCIHDPEPNAPSCNTRYDCPSAGTDGDEFQCNQDRKCVRSRYLGLNGLVRLTAHDCDGDDPSCTLTDAHDYSSYGIAFCEVIIQNGEGRCTINTSVKRAIAGAAPREWCPMRYPAGKTAGLELLVGGLQQCTREVWDTSLGPGWCDAPIPPSVPFGPRYQCVFLGDTPAAIQAGLLVGRPKDGAAIDGPAKASTASAHLVTGYQRCELAGPGRMSTSFTNAWSGCLLAPARNDPACGFGIGGYGTATAKVRGSDVTLQVEARGLSCPNATLCLSSSDLIVTNAFDCGGPSGTAACTVEDRPDRLTGRGDWNTGRTGCATVDANGNLRISTSLNRLSPGLIRDGYVSSGAFFRTGLLRVDEHGNKATVGDVEVGPAFVVGIFAP